MTGSSRCRLAFGDIVSVGRSEVLFFSAAESVCHLAEIRGVKLEQ